MVCYRRLWHPVTPLCALHQPALHPVYESSWPQLHHKTPSAARARPAHGAERGRRRWRLSERPRRRSLYVPTSRSMFDPTSRKQRLCHGC